MEKIYIGKVLKPQGLKGEVKISCQLDDASLLLPLKFVYLNEKRIDLKSIRAAGAFAVVLFSTFSDRSQAEMIVNEEIFVDANQIKLPADRFFVDDVIGNEVFLDDGFFVGKVVDILQNSRSTDVYVVQNEKKETMFPLLKELIVSFDVSNKKIVLCKKRFEEVAVRED